MENCLKKIKHKTAAAWHFEQGSSCIGFWTGRGYIHSEGSWFQVKDPKRTKARDQNLQVLRIYPGWGQEMLIRVPIRDAPGQGEPYKQWKALHAALWRRWDLEEFWVKSNEIWCIFLEAHFCCLFTHCCAWFEVRQGTRHCPVAMAG